MHSKLALKTVRLPSCEPVVSIAPAGKTHLLSWKTLFQTPLQKGRSKKENQPSINQSINQSNKQS